MMTITNSDEDKILKTVGLELMFATPEKQEYEHGMTAVEIARRCKFNLNIVKKKLRILNEKGIIRSKGVSPKFWKFDDYRFQRMAEDDPIYLLLCSFDDVDFDKYFDY